MPRVLPVPGTPDQVGVEVGVGSRLCGVVHLVNLLDLANLLDQGRPAPADSTDDVRVAGWMLVEGLLRGLTDGAFDGDPMWSVLARLDGRAPGVRGDPAPRWLLGRVDDELVRALGAGDADAADALEVPGSVLAGPTHVDVHVPLGAVSLPLRLAGLDRSPGWVPWLARVVTLTFDDDR